MRRGHLGAFGDVESWTAAGSASVNCAPPSGAVLGPHAPVLDGEQTAHDPQAHARAGGPRFRRGTAIEALEQVRQVGRRDARTMIAHLDDEPIRPDASGHVHDRSGR